MPELKKHGIDMPTWMWNMAKEGKIRTAQTSISAWIRNAMIEQAKREKFFGTYRKMLDKQIGGENESNGQKAA